MPHRTFTSALWQVNAVLLDGGLLVDSVVLPAELAALPRPERGLVVTHAHFDHVLARSVFPDLPLHAGPSTRRRLAERGEEVLAELRESDEELYVERDRLPAFGDLRGLDELEGVEWVPAEGHAEDGAALLVADEGLLLPGDHLIAVEIPLVSAAGSPAAYAATLERLEPLVRRARVIQPGHGPPLGREEALRLLELDHRYVSDLAAGPTRGPRSARQERIHADNVKKHVCSEKGDG
jgi:glyoxylase-like metal-dependent hydrolase (beta-lactamase superfamily II)